MRAIPRNSLARHVLWTVVVWLFIVAHADAQLLTLRHPPIPIIISNNQGGLATRQAPPTSNLQASKPLAAPAAGASCTPVGSQPAPIAALVVALKCDPDLIFEYVYNNIEFEPLYGSIKGPLGTLLDRRGGDADQAILLVTLLQTAGYSEAQFAEAAIRLTGTQLSNWLGVANDAAAISNLLNDGYFPYIANSDGTFDVAHFDVSLQLSGTTYLFDPSYKQHAVATGVSNLASALGYSRSQFLTDVGGTLNSVSIANVNRTALRADLTAYANNLVAYINQTNRTWSVGNVIGGTSIQSLTGSPIRQTSFPNLSPIEGGQWLTFPSFPVDCPQEGVTTECRTYVIITMPGAPASQAIKLYTDQIYGHRITISSVQSGSDFIPKLLVDGAAPACVGAGTCTNVGNAQPADSSWSINVQVVEANQDPSQVTPCGTGITACKTLSAAAGGSYLVSTGVGQVGRGMPEYHRQLLAQARAAGNADSTELVLGESLAVIGYSWLAECSAEHQLTDQLAGTTTIYYFGIGIVGQWNIQQSGFQGPYVDLPLNAVNVVPQSSTGPTMTIGSYSYPIALISSFFTHAETLSAFESGVLEQTQAPVGMTAASTIKIIDDNMNAAYSDALQTTFYADGTTQAGQSFYANSICPNLQKYQTADLAVVNSAVFGQSSGDSCTVPSNFTPGQQVLLPQNGYLPIGVGPNPAWNGAGYTTISPQANGAIGIVQKITGGMSGGFSAVSDPDPPPNTEITIVPANSFTTPQLIIQDPGPTDPQTQEPVDSVTGAYIYNHADLVTGSGQFPYALPFARTYLSSSGTYLTTTTADAGIGNGWSHNYRITAQADSDPYIGMGGSDSPAVSAATSIAALYVIKDLLSITPTAQTMTVSSMVARWFTDQLTGNVVMVEEPNTTEEFVALPHADGSTNYAFNAPPGSSVQFTQVSAGQYAYLRKDAVTLNFGPTPAGALQSMIFPNGMSVSLGYSGSQLARISNNLGRSLSLTYSGNDLTAVADDTGRTVSYGYDSNHNLTSFSDPLGANTTYSYDSTGTYDTFGHLTQVYYPFRPGNPFVTNWYDQLGRVIQQANANGFRSSFYFAGSRSELVDAIGDRHVTYQTDRGKVLKDAVVLSSSFGDVFNDTPQQNGVINITTDQYDGLDRLTLTTLPEGGTTAYSYAATNPWANNIASITRTPKPGSTLSPLTTGISYDLIYNKPTQITDPLGLVTTLAHDPSTGNLLSATADAGALPHFNATARFTYDRFGKVVTSTDPDGVTTASTYDSFENLIARVSDSGAGHLNLTTLLSYDRLGNVISTTDPNGNTTVRTYDADRRLLTTTAPTPFNAAPSLVQTTNSYDPDGHIITVTRANGGTPVVTQMSYTATGQVQTVTDANGNVTTNAYDADDRLASVTDPLFRMTVYGYDAMSRRISVSNPAIQATPLLQQSYTPDGLIGSLTDANSNTTTFTPDGFDRLATTTYADSSTETLSYDADGNVLARQTRAGATISFTYDTLNRLATKAAPSEPTVNYSYDQASHLVGLSDNSAAITAPAASASYVTNLAYDQLNRPIAVNWSPAPAQTAPSAASASFSFAYDATNRRIGQSATDNSWWSYPATATNVSYTANNLNQYSAVGSVTPSYDGNGNLSYDGSFSYCYDAESRLTGVVQGSCSSPTSTVAGYAYDAQGRRKSKSVGGTTTIYVTDANNREILEYDGSSGAVQNWYSYGLGANDVLNQMNVAAGTRATFIPDILGSFVGTLDATSGALTKFGYQTYGESASPNQTFAYTGQRIDPETNGLYYYRARMYMPAWGRFMQVDPSGNNGPGGLYVYVRNDPLNLFDALGLSPDGPAATSWLASANTWLQSAFSSPAMDQAAQGYMQNVQSEIEFQQAHPTLVLGTAGAGFGILGGVAALPEVLGVGGAITTEETGGALAFSQTTASPFFSSQGTFAGQSIADVAAQLRAGTLATSEVPVQTVNLGGGPLIVNTRSALALMQGGIPQSVWNLIMGNATTEAQVAQRLISNGLTTSGTDVLRITGSGPYASTLIPGP